MHNGENKKGVLNNSNENTPNLSEQDLENQNLQKEDSGNEHADNTSMEISATVRCCQHHTAVNNYEELSMGTDNGTDMGTDMVNHQTGADSSKTIFSLHFTLPQWRKFWNLIVVGSTMAELLASLDKIILEANILLISSELVRRWIQLSEELVYVCESLS